MDVDYGKNISFSRLKEVIQDNKLKINEFAKMLGKNSNDISQIINGVRLPKTDLIAKLCFVLKCTADDICVFKGIKPTEYQKKWYEGIGVLYKPSEDAVGEVTYRPLRRLLEVYLEGRVNEDGKKLTPDDFYDKVESARRRNKNYDTSGKGIKAALEARGFVDGYEPITAGRTRKKYDKGLPYPTRTKLRQDRALNIRTVYDICKVLGCTPSFVMSYK